MTNKLIKKIFFTSDWHVGHANVIKYSKRPFKDCDHMHKVLINNYNNTVPEDGICYFLGDMGFCSAEFLTRILAQLNGTKILILGNHDKGMNAMYKQGFDAVLNSASLIIANELVTLSHCPLKGVYREDASEMKGALEGENWHGELRHKEFTLEDRGQFHLHGHLHAPNSGKSKVKLGRQWDIGVDGNNFTPVSKSAIESWISKMKNGDELDG